MAKPLGGTIMRRLAGLLGALALLMLFAPPATAKDRPVLIVVSIDGFRADYFDRHETPALADLARTGVHARSMRPSFPSVTAPNHYTLMTGLYPDHHGIVDNSFVDPAMPGVMFGGPHGWGANDDPRWWNQATPLWVTAERAGIKTASSLWPGDSPVIHGVAPAYLEPRTPPPSMDRQVDTVLGWIDLPEGKRPGLIRLHLDVVDAMGHVYGPDNPVTDKAIAQADGEIGRLVDGLRSRGLYDGVNLVVVSDHGMTRLPPHQLIYIDDLIDVKSVVVTTEYATGGVNPLPGHEVEVAKALVGRHDHMTCWRRGDIPARLRYGSNPRVPAILCLADLGWTVATRATLGHTPPFFGNHGYDPAEPDMAAFFLAHGPAFRPGATLPTFENVDVYPLLARVLGVKAVAGDGRIAEVAAALR